MADVKYPAATWRPVDDNATEPSIVPTQIILHTAVDAKGPSTLFHWWQDNRWGLESHMWFPFAGTPEQYVSLTRSADANRRANRRPDGTGALSAETEDDGTPIKLPWNDHQLAGIIRWMRWCMDRFPEIAPRQCRNPDDPGLGWHAMWGAPSDWTPADGKTCPGSTRIAQIKEVVFPAVLGHGPVVIDPPVQTFPIRNGDTGPLVERVQTDLIELGYDLGPAGADGKFGDDTEAAVREFQRHAGVPTTNYAGVWGNQTEAAYHRALKEGHIMATANEVVDALLARPVHDPVSGTNIPFERMVRNARVASYQSNVKAGAAVRLVQSMGDVEGFDDADRAAVIAAMEDALAEGVDFDLTVTRK